MLIVILILNIGPCTIRYYKITYFYLVKDSKTLTKKSGVAEDWSWRKEKERDLSTIDKSRLKSNKHLKLHKFMIDHRYLQIFQKFI